jgi:hypothetical protein
MCGGRRGVSGMVTTEHYYVTKQNPIQIKKRNKRNANAIREVKSERNLSREINV